MRRAWPLFFASGLAGCTSVFFFPDSHVYDQPERLGLAFDTPTFRSLDGTKITGIFLKPKARPARGTVVHFHGNGANMTAQWGFSSWLAEEGFNVFVLDYRGFGASEGKATVAGAVKDGVAALDYVAARPEVDLKRIVVFGQSLGCAIAVASVAQSTTPVQALVLEAPFDSYRAIARDRLALFWLTRTIRWPLSFIASDRYRPSRLIKRLPRPTPLLVVHGTADRVVPASLGMRLYEAAPQPKELWLVPGADHVQAFTSFGKTYRPKLVKFLDAALTR